MRRPVRGPAPAVLAGTWLLLGCAAASPDVAWLVQARALRPTYVGHQDSLGDEGRSRIEAGIEILDAGLGTPRSDEAGDRESRLAALRLRADFHKLLGEDDRNRLRDEAAFRTEYGLAKEDLSACLRWDPSDGWVLYTLGVVHAQLGEHGEALAALDGSVRVLDQNVAADPAYLGQETNRLDLFKALQWRGSERRATEHDAAGAWRDLQRAAELIRPDPGPVLPLDVVWIEREAATTGFFATGDFASTRSALKGLLARESEFPNVPPEEFALAHESLGLVQGLSPDPALLRRAAESLARAEARGDETFYTKYWQWLVTPAEDADMAHRRWEDLQEYVRLAPSYTPFETLLFAFVGERFSEEEFLRDVRTLTADASYTGDGLLEAWFFVGGMREEKGEPARALDAYRRSVALPHWESWEWEYAGSRSKLLATRVGVDMVEGG